MYVRVKQRLRLTEDGRSWSEARQQGRGGWHRWRPREYLPIDHVPDPLHEPVASLVLVRSERVDGKPRQRFVAHLGSISGDDLRRPEELRARLWAALEEALRAKGITDAEREQARRSLASRLPAPTGSP